MTDMMLGASQEALAILRSKLLADIVECAYEEVDDLHRDVVITQKSEFTRFQELLEDENPDIRGFILEPLKDIRHPAIRSRWAETTSDLVEATIRVLKHDHESFRSATRAREELENLRAIHEGAPRDD